MSTFDSACTRMRQDPKTEGELIRECRESRVLSVSDRVSETYTDRPFPYSGPERIVVSHMVGLTQIALVHMCHFIECKGPGVSS